MNEANRGAGTTGEAGLSDSPGYRASHVAYLLALPWLQLLLNPNLFMTPGGNRYLDPWVYTGCFLSPSSLIQHFGQTYYCSRFAWIGPGYVVHSLFSPVVANYVLHIGFFYGLLLATYQLVATGTNRRTAFFVTMVVAWSPIVLSGLSWDYVDGAGMTYLIATLMCLEKAVQSRSRAWAWSLAAGFLVACSIGSNLFLALLFPVWGLFVFLRAGFSRWRSLVLIYAAGLAGLGLGLLTLGLAYQSVGGSLNVLAVQIRVSQGFLSAPNDWMTPVSAWIFRATWLVAPTLAAIGALVTFRQWARLPLSFGGTMQVVFLTALTGWFVVHVQGTPAFQVSYYSSYLASLGLLSFALLFDVPSPKLPVRTTVVLEFATVAVFAASHWFVASDPLGFWSRVGPSVAPMFAAPWWGGNALASFLMVLGLGGGVFALVINRIVAWASVRWVLVALALAVVSCAVPPDLASRLETSNPQYFELTVEAHRYIARNISDRKLRVWFGPRPTSIPTVAIGSTYLWGFSLLSYEMPALTKKLADTLDRKTRLAVIAPTLDDVNQASVPLRTFGFETEIVASQQFGSGETRFVVAMIDLK